jgi:hypothetical protein
MTVPARLEARVKRLEGAVAGRAWRRSPAGALDALMTGNGSRADLEILYEVNAASIRESLVARGVDRVVVPNLLGGMTWHWIGRILSYPPDAEVPDQYRKELATAAAWDNPYDRLLHHRTKCSPKQRDENVHSWITEQLYVIGFDRNDELELRAEVAARVPTDPADIEEYLRGRQ